MSRGSHALNLMNKGGHSVDSAVMRLRPELRHWEKIKVFNVSVDTFGHDLL